MGFFKKDVSPEKQREALEAMCPECRKALMDNGQLSRPDEPFVKFDGTQHVLIDGIVPFCKVYWNPETVERRQKNSGGIVQ